ncbi:MAG: hypothetical protein J6M10_04305 [Clostridia bacterium]|nr:hypothetical protein [Clostridia bacterium]
MKKILCMLLALMLLLGMACAESAATEAATPEAPATPEASAAPIEAPAEPVVLGFEDGFSLELPAGWKYYALNDEMAAQGVLYCLSDASAQRWLYIQSWDTDCADIDSLQDLIDRTAMPQTSGIYTFNGTDFVIYDLVEGDVSCCAALVDGRVLNFVFTPQSDAAFMATATQIIGSFGVLAK